MIGADGQKLFLQNFARKDAPQGWYSFDMNGVHFVAIVNVFNFEKMGLIGNEELAWIDKDLKAQKASTPIVVFGHVPLYALYEPWGWTTEDGGKVIAMLQRFDNVTVLNGHIHQIIEHTLKARSGLRTAAATSYPQPAPGTAPNPGPVASLPPDKLLSTVGYPDGQRGRQRSDRADRHDARLIAREVQCPERRGGAHPDVRARGGRPPSTRSIAATRTCAFPSRSTCFGRRTTRRTACTTRFCAFRVSQRARLLARPFSSPAFATKRSRGGPPPPGIAPSRNVRPCASSGL